MAIESGTDLAYFFETDDFGTSANFTSPALGSVNGIFDAETIEVELGGDVGVLAPQPTFKARTSDLTGVSEGSAVTISSTNYLVKNRMDDGTGTTELQREEA